MAAEANQVCELVSNIYDASINPGLWPRVLEQTCGYIQGIAAVLVAHQTAAGSGEFYFSWGDDPAYTEQPDLLPDQPAGRSDVRP
jgi:hypothetical protein